MAFAIFYEQSDLAAIAANVNGVQFASQNDRNLARACWNGGLSGWQTAPQGVSTCNPGEPPNPLSYRVVINATLQGQPVTLQQFRDLLYRIAALNPQNAAVQYIIALADDMGRASGACEPA